MARVCISHTNRIFSPSDAPIDLDAQKFHRHASFFSVLLGDQPAPVLRDTLTASRVDGIIDSYSVLLERGVAEWDAAGMLVYPESLLPASRPEIEESILSLGRKLHRNGQFTQASRETLRHCYSQLAHFVPDDLAHRARAHSLALRERRFIDVAADGEMALSVLSTSIKAYELRLEAFDALLNEKLRPD